MDGSKLGGVRLFRSEKLGRPKAEEGVDMSLKEYFGKMENYNMAHGQTKSKSVRGRLELGNLDAGCG